MSSLHLFTESSNFWGNGKTETFWANGKPELYTAIWEQTNKNREEEEKNKKARGNYLTLLTPDSAAEYGFKQGGLDYKVASFDPLLTQSTGDDPPKALPSGTYGYNNGLRYSAIEFPPAPEEGPPRKYRITYGGNIAVEGGGNTRSFLEQIVPGDQPFTPSDMFPARMQIFDTLSNATIYGSYTGTSFIWWNGNSDPNNKTKIIWYAIDGGGQTVSGRNLSMTIQELEPEPQCLKNSDCGYNHNCVNGKCSVYRPDPAYSYEQQPNTFQSIGSIFPIKEDNPYFDPNCANLGLIDFRNGGCRYIIPPVTGTGALNYCQRACNDDGNCNAFMYQKSANKCFFLNSENTDFQSVNNDYDFYRKIVN